MGWFTLAGTKNSTGGQENKTPATRQALRYISTDNENRRYTLEITENINENLAVYTPRSGDSFVLSVELNSGGNYTVSLACSGTVHNSSGAALTLKLSANSALLSIAIENGNMTVISGTIVSDDGETEMMADEPITLTPIIDKANLKNVIDTANTAKDGVVTSVNGDDVPATVCWVTTEQMNIFTSTISSVQAIYDNDETNQATVDLATDALLTSISSFNGQKKAGTKREGSKKSPKITVH